MVYQFWQPGIQAQISADKKYGSEVTKTSEIFGYQNLESVNFIRKFETKRNTWIPNLVFSKHMDTKFGHRHYFRIPD